jgi:hypothetical protein
MIPSETKQFAGYKKYSESLNIVLPYCFFLFFALLYIFLPSQNSSVDAYNYAANLKWDHDLFFPHHLLYNYFQSIIFELTIYFHLAPDVLSLMKLVNSIFALFALCIFYIIIKELNKINEETDEIKPLSLLLFAGSSFGFMRYSTENETYIIPIFWSLLASYYFLRYLSNNHYKYLILSGFMATTSCLFHQIHIFWYIGLLMATYLYKRQIFSTLIILTPSLFIPIAYYIALKLDHYDFTKAQNLWQFMLYDYFYGTANTNLNIQNLILGFISFVRNFIQIHGIIPLLIKKMPLYSILFIPVVIFIFK